MFERFRKKKAAATEPAPPERSMGAVLDEFLTLPLPDAVDGLAFRVSMAPDEGPGAVSGFERYAARVLGEVGAHELRATAAENPLGSIRLDSTGLFWMRFDREGLEPDQFRGVLDAETALNRLELVHRAAAASSDAQLRTDPSEAACSLLDWSAIRSVADGAAALLDKCQPDNPLLSLRGTTAVRGGNWDVLTRLTARCEEAVLPFRLTYRLDADMASSVMQVRFLAPEATAFPRSRWDAEARQWVDATGERPAAAASYTLRVSVLLAAAALGASVGVRRVVVNAHGCSLDEPALLSLEFERMAFMSRTLPALARGAFGEPGTECAFGQLLELAAPRRKAVELDADGGLAPVEPVHVSLPDQRPPLADDERLVPVHLAAALHADQVRELDVMSVQDETLVDHFRAIMDDSDDAPLLAIAQLEELLSSIEAADRQALQAAGEGLVPLYCQGVYARCLVGLADVPEQARFLRASDIGYAARSALLQLYLDLGDHEAALAQGRACVELAPSSPAAYQDQVNALMAAEDFAAVVDAEKQALRLVVSPDETAYLYYRLAFAFWKTGQHDLGLACYLRVPPHAPVGEMAATERAELMAEMKLTDVEGFDRDAVLRAGGVPLAPTAEATDRLAAMAIAFCDAGIPLMAAPMAAMLGAIERNDVLSALAGSLRDGTR